MKKILNQVLKEIKATKEEEKEVKDKITSLLISINKNLKDAKAILGGSGVKGTWLKEANDVDIFVKFNYKKYKDKSEQLSNLLEKHLKKKFKKLIKLHGSRDYFQIKGDKWTNEIIPILDIKKSEQAKNITDVSPLHANWVNKKGKTSRDDIRLLKQFCRSIGVYGAESYIQGISGYICEILIINYKGFINTIKNAAKWNDKVMIDVEKYWKGKNILMELNKSKTHSPLIVIDPVQKDRNAAAAISEEKFNLFKKYAKEFLKNPSKKFFEIKKINEQQLKKYAKNNTLILIDLITKKGKRDVMGCKLVKAKEFINKKLQKNDFNILKQGWQWNKNALFYFIIKKEKLSNLIEREGPPLKTKEHVKKFKKKYKKTFIKKGRIYAKEKRKFKTPEELIRSLKDDNYLKEKIKSFKLR
jgi:tRNA nucleotidyltransferase (CCA-adding enzyme)